MTPANIQLDAIVRGDTWLGIDQVGPLTDDFGNPMPCPVAVAALAFKSGYDDAVPAYVFTSDSSVVGRGVLTILDPDGWVVSITEQPLPLSAGTWLWDLQFTDTNGDVLTPLQGTLVVLPDVTP